MSIPNFKKSDPDVSSSSSWILINESFDNRKDSREIVNIDDADDIDKQSDGQGNFQDVRNSECSLLIEENPEESNSTTEEFYPLEDYLPMKRNTNKSSLRRSKTKPKKKKKEETKQEIDTLSLISIAACILTITGITILTNLLPPAMEDNAIENIQNNYLEVIHPKKANGDDVIKTLNTTYDTINMAKEMDLFAAVEKIMASNYTEDESCAALESWFNLTDSINNNSGMSVGPLNFENIDGEAQLNVSFLEKSLLKGKEFLTSSASTMLKCPALHVILATVMQDICLIRLVKELSKKKEKKEETTTPAAAKTDKIVRKQPKITKKKPTKKSLSVENVGLAKRKATINKNGTITKSMSVKALTPCCGKLPMSSDSNIINKISTRYSNNLSNQKVNENGKSECERRFEELDTEWQTVGQNHRQNIQQIKARFQKEIFAIKETEKETLNRTQRMNLTREKYLQRLKNDREKYVSDLRKIRQERQKLLGKICHQKYDVAMSSSKDAAVGNYAVLLPNSYDFKQKLNSLKEKEESCKISLPSLTIDSSLTFSPKKVPNNSIATVVSNPSPNVTKKQKVLKSRSKLKESSKKLEEYSKKYCEIKKKYLKKKSKLLRKRRARKDSSELPAVKDVVNDILSNLSSNQTLALQTKPPSNKNIFSADTQNKTVKDLQLVFSPKSPKRNINDVYDAAFDKASKKIKRLDFIKWTRSEKLPQKFTILSKQNLTRPGTKEKPFTFKGPL